MSAQLHAVGIGVRYGGLEALADVEIEVGEGRLVGLIGPNGAGKTTFIDAITGFIPASGTVELGGVEISGLSPERRARMGLARTWQSGELFEDLSVRENLAVAAGRPTPATLLREFFPGRREREPGVERALDLVELTPFADSAPASLSQGQRKLVGVARALAAQPRVVLLDEPAAGLDSEESKRFGRLLREITAQGTAMLLIDHDMGLVLSECDHVVVLDFGRVIAAGPPDQVRRDPAVIEAYLGKAAAGASAPAPPSPSGVA